MSLPERRQNSSSQLINVVKIKETLYRHKLMWIAPTVVFTILGLLYVITKENEWVAQQTLIVRDEAIGEMSFGGNTSPLGRFDSTDSLKRFLETVLQVSQNREVLRAALEQTGPPKNKKRSKKAGPYPNEKEIEKFGKDVAVTAPKGTEFGSSEVLHLLVTSNDRQRAIRLANAVCSELENRLRVIRNEYAQSIITEMQEKKILAERDLEIVTAKLSEIESRIGEDLSELRTLAEGTTGDSALQRQANQIKAEIRLAESKQDGLEELLSLLRRFSDNPEAILATPNTLLKSQPGLKRLKDGLVDAQLRTARLQGGLTELHPKVQSAKQNELNVEAQLMDEVENSVISLQADIGLVQRQIRSLKRKIGNVEDRMDDLAAKRAPYVNLVAEVNQRREQVRSATTSLAEARGRQEASRTSSLITRVDTPVTGSTPKGPGRTVLLLGCSAAGLAFGLSFVYLLAPWQEARRGRRLTDRVGRRATDRMNLGYSAPEDAERRAGTRASDIPTASPGSAQPNDDAIAGLEVPSNSPPTSPLAQRPTAANLTPDRTTPVADLQPELAQVSPQFANAASDSGEQDSSPPKPAPVTQAPTSHIVETPNMQVPTSVASDSPTQIMPTASERSVRAVEQKAPAAPAPPAPSPVVPAPAAPDNGPQASHGPPAWASESSDPFLDAFEPRDDVASDDDDRIPPITPETPTIQLDIQDHSQANAFSN